MKIYNSRTEQLETFVPINDNEVTMYVCGPTVYGEAHIGNARPLIVFDTVVRVLKELGYRVNYLSNYTDIDDKIINKALDEQVSEEVISKRYIDAYEQLRKALNAKLPNTIKVTNSIDSIIEFIDQLIKLGYAYEIEGDVYFRVNKVPTYGELSNQKLEDVLVGARIDENSLKEDPLDFTLWKQTDKGVNYTSPWSKGRPGWHTECVVMIQKHFATNLIDIHGGGMDLRFPHHENEMAQAEAIAHSHLANYWMHNGLINIDGIKMSKSLGNTVMAKEFIEQLGADVVRWFVQSVHYRSPLRISDDSIAQTKAELNKIYLALNQATIKVQLEIGEFGEEIDQADMRLFMVEMEDDFNTANAYKVIFDTTKKLNSLVRSRELDYEQIINTTNAIIRMINILGIDYQIKRINDEDRSIFAMWNTAKQKQDFTAADQYRQQLTERGLL